MGANVGALTVSLGLDAAQYTEGLTKADVQAQQFAQQQTRTQASIDRTVASLAKQASQIGMTTREIKLQTLAAKGASDAQLASADASLKALEAAAAAAAKHAAEMRTAGKETEGFSLASHAAQRELVVLAHELSQGNVKKFGSSLLVLAENTGAAGLLFSGMAVAVAAAAAGIGAFVFAAVKGAEESRALARAIDETGNVAGLTEGKFNDLAAAQAKQTNSTIGASRDLLQSLAASGRFSGQALTAAGTAAAYFSKATGTSTEDVGKEFVGLADDVVGGADRMNRQFHFLTATQLDYIKTLHEQGADQKAIVLTLDALSDRLKGVESNLGTLGSAWQTLKNKASSAWDAMLNIGRTETVEQQLASVGEKLRNARLNPRQALTESDIAATAGQESPAVTGLLQQQGILQDDLKLTNQIAEAQAAKVRQDQAEIAVYHLKEASLTKQERLTKDLANANAIFDNAGAAKNDPDRLKVLADIREKAFPANAQKSTLDLDVAKIKAAAQAEEEIYANANTIFSALRSAGLIDDEHYYAEKLYLLKANATAEETALTAEIARRKQQTFAGEGAANKANENAKSITEAESKLAKLRKDTTAQETALSIESVAAQNRRAAGYLAEELAAQQSLDATKRAHAEEIALVGVGGEARTQSQAHSQITDRYQAEIDRADAEIAAKRAAAGGAATADDEAAYATRIALLQKYQAASLAEWDAYYAKLKATEADASKGWQKGLADYETSVGSMADRVSKAVGDSFKSLEDSLVTAFETGKVSAKSFGETVSNALVRIAVQEEITKPLAQFLKGSTAGPGAGNGGSGLLSSFLNLFSSKGTGAGTGETAMGSAAGVLGAADSQAASAAAAAETGLATSATTAATTMTTAAGTTEGALASLAAAASSAASALASVSASGASSSGASGAGGLLGLFGGSGSGSAAGAGAVDNGSVNLFAGETPAPGLAAGGRALPGKLYPVTERGPEVLDVNGKQYLMTGGGRANVSPVSSGGQAQSQRPIQIIQQFAAGTSKATADQAAQRAGRAVSKALSRVG